MFELRLLTVRRLMALVPVVVACWDTAPVRAAEKQFDVIIRNGRVVDGSGTSSFVADVAIADGKIAAVGRIKADTGRREIDATGLVVSPGFIDMMGQSATPMLRDPKAAINLLTQGITTINAGEGGSAAPLSDKAGRTAGWTTMTEYFQLLELQGLPVNVVQTVGHTQVREMVLGEIDRRPSEEELERMRSLVREAMEAGAIGVSTALIYPPAVYATTDEIAALAEVAGEFGGRYYTHMRNEGDQLLEAIDEALAIGRKARTPVHIFHLKTAGRQNWGKMPLAIARVKAARAEGYDVTADIYPYINNGLSLEAFIHPRHFAHGRSRLLAQLNDPAVRKEIRNEMETGTGWENWFRHVGNDWGKVIIGQVSGEKYAKLTGRSLAEIAESLEQDPWDTFFELVRAGAFALPQSMSEANKIQAMQEEFVSFCTDVGPAGGSDIASHPRAFGAFPRLLSRYVRELGAISLEQAVAQASAGAANKVCVYDRGRIAEGLAADIVVFDADSVADNATFASPRELSTGIKHVFVNGVQVLRDGKFTEKRPGRVLRGPGYAADKAPSAVSTGKLDDRLAPIDRLVREFMEQQRIPGAALAITDHGRLVLARGYGYADLAAKKQVEPTSLFRIASISKPITAVAVLQLAEQGKFRLEDRIFDILKYDPHLEKDAVFDERYRTITIQQLLQHRGGWDRDVSFDAMFQSIRFANALHVPPPAQPEHVIACMLGLKLDFNPGERYAYSNFGYCLLGRLIEVASQQDYEAYVREHVFAPLGIERAQLGTTHADREPSGNEVHYYSPDVAPSVFAEDAGTNVPSAYGGWNLEAMDSHGGWIASPVDLVRFAAAFDEPANCGLLKPDSIERMFAAPIKMSNEDKPGDTFYSCGWTNRPRADGKFDSWHTGSLPGTATLLVRRHDGRNFAIVFNARSSPDIAHFGQAINEKLNKALDQIEEWPDTDLFPEYFE
jgi:N-acyl-D-amino-acid deacylase